jgi:hypothetical protein
MQRNKSGTDAHEIRRISKSNVAIEYSYVRLCEPHWATRFKPAVDA